MEIKVFTEIIREELEKRTGLEVRVQEVIKNNNIILHGICITEPGCNITPTIYLDKYYEYHKEGMSIERIAAYIMELAQENKVGTALDMEWFRDFEQVRDKVRFKLVNY